MAYKGLKGRFFFGVGRGSWDSFQYIVLCTLRPSPGVFIRFHKKASKMSMVRKSDEPAKLAEQTYPGCRVSTSQASLWNPQGKRIFVPILYPAWCCFLFQELWDSNTWHLRCLLVIPIWGDGVLGSSSFGLGQDCIGGEVVWSQTKNSKPLTLR